MANIFDSFNKSITKYSDAVQGIDLNALNKSRAGALDYKDPYKLAAPTGEDRAQADRLSGLAQQYSTVPEIDQSSRPQQDAFRTYLDVRAKGQGLESTRAGEQSRANATDDIIGTYLNSRMRAYDPSVARRGERAVSAMPNKYLLDQRASERDESNKYGMQLADYNSQIRDVSQQTKVSYDAWNAAVNDFGLQIQARMQSDQIRHLSEEDKRRTVLLQMEREGVLNYIADLKRKYEEDARSEAQLTGMLTAGIGAGATVLAGPVGGLIAGQATNQVAKAL